MLRVHTQHCDDAGMTTEAKPRIRLGDLLVASKLITAGQLEDALASQKESGLRIGEALISLGYITELQVAQVLSHQLSVPWVNLLHVNFSRELLNLLSADVAAQTRMIPIYVRRVRQQGDVLFVATDDPLNESAITDAAAHAGMPVKVMVASALDIRDALRVYYGRTLASPTPLRVASNSIASPSEEDLEIDFEALAEASERALAEAEAESAAPVEAVQAPEPAPRTRAKKPSSGRALTLLDGTKIQLPEAGEEGAEETPTGLTSRDLVQALLRRAEGKDVSDVLPDAHWETLFATLLSLMLKKGLIADWEFVEQWNKVQKRDQRAASKTSAAEKKTP